MQPHPLVDASAVAFPTSGSATWTRTGRWAAALLALVLAACGGGDGGNNFAFSLLPTPTSPSTPSEPAAPAPLTVGGTVSGLKGSGLVLVNNGGDALAVSADGAFTFPTALGQGAAYAVSVRSQPGGPSQACTVNAGSGTVSDTAVASVKVLCATQAYTVGGTVSGLAGGGLVLQNNAADDLPVSADGTFVFPAAVASGASYAVTVKTQPGAPVQLCSVAQGSGPIDAADVASVQVVCAIQTRSVSVTVSGLDGQGLVLQNNAGDDLPVGADGKLQFAARVAEGAAYAVTVKAQPRMYTQACTVGRGTGTAGAADIDDVTVACVTPTVQSIYVASNVIGSISMLARYSPAGLALESTTTGLPADLVSLAADPKGRLVFGGTPDGRVYAIVDSGGGTDTVTLAALLSGGRVSLGMHPGGEYLYAADGRGAQVSTYRVDAAAPTTPTLQGTQILGFGNATSAIALAVDPLARFVFTGTPGLGLGTLPIRANGTLGTATLMSSPDVVSIAVHPGGAYLYTLTTDNQLRTYAIDPSTGALTQTHQELVGPASPSGNTISLTIDGRGRTLSLVGTSEARQYVRQITDTATGALGPAISYGVSPAPVATVFDASRDGVNYLLGPSYLAGTVIDLVSSTYAISDQQAIAPTASVIALLAR